MVKLNLFGRTPLYPNAEICVDGSTIIQRCLLDSGATFCHMTYSLWEQMGLNEILFEDLSKTTEFFKHLMSIRTADDLNFKNLPLTAVTTRLGNGKFSNTYQVMIDSLIIKGSPDMVFPNVTVRLIDSEEFSFIIGMNIIKYLSIQYHPTIESQMFTIGLEKEGYELYLADQQRGINNDLKVHFKLMSDYILDQTLTIEELTEEDWQVYRYIQVKGKVRKIDSGLTLEPLFTGDINISLKRLFNAGIIKQTGDIYEI